MKKLNYEVLRETGYEGYILEDAPVKVLQFGEGNFMRAFVDYFFDMANEKAGWNGKIRLVKPRAGAVSPHYEEQEGLYTLYLRGSVNGEKISDRRVLSAVDGCLSCYDPEDWQELIRIAESDELEYITSNTTEAGLIYDPEAKLEQDPPASFPAKLTKILLARFRAGKDGLIILPCELIDNNGRELLKIVDRHITDWGLGEEFRAWVKEKNQFCSTLVDRIVPGGIKDPKELAELHQENGYEDSLIDVGEVFGVWYIEGSSELAEKLPFQKAGLNVHVVPEVAPYKKRKVRILNGAHTGFVLGAYLAGKSIVRECMEDDTIRGFMNTMLYEEVIPVLPLDRADCEEFAAAVTDRFNNPFVDHQLMSISLNSTAKWKARNLPSLQEYVEKFGKLPRCLTMSFAAYLAFYSPRIQERTEDGLLCQRDDGTVYKVQDDAWVLDFYYDRREASDEELVHAVMTNERMWDGSLAEIEGMEAAVAADLALIRQEGAEAAFASCLKNEKDA